MENLLGSCVCRILYELVYIRCILATKRGHPGTQSVPSLPSIHMSRLQTFKDQCYLVHLTWPPAISNTNAVEMGPESLETSCSAFTVASSKAVSSVADAMDDSNRYLGNLRTAFQRCPKAEYWREHWHFLKLFKPCMIDHLDFNSCANVHLHYFEPYRAGLHDAKPKLFLVLGMLSSVLWALCSVEIC